ncbi:hypothetical protein CU098_011435 [Rhizopus stolonifer]|uniref:Rho-GAP domain-containing protein n=1 Tax=Rhizopus stolonifer TaxID=4846 RepID=A0A367KJZ2_RHIST|nr:hypothetical protein CU098_011435 [Rhizopus stolonifer]
MIDYSFDFVTNITYLCIDEIRKRGLDEPKIFCKSMPNKGLFIKVFDRQECTKEDLLDVHIHSVASLMLETLWSGHDRIISKKTWRKINYSTCTLSSLSNTISSKSEQFLIDILEFLIELLDHKQQNKLNAYKLGDALGKVVLGPADCSPIMTEKAGHFLTRMIIEHAKIKHRQKKATQAKLIHRIDSGYQDAPSYSCHSFYSEYRPICKSQGTLARAKHYNRVASRKKKASIDWTDHILGVQSMLDNDYDLIPEPPEKPWISIFTSADMLSKKNIHASPILYRILREACKPLLPKRSDPFSMSYLFSSKAFWVEAQLAQAFNEFYAIRIYTENMIKLYESQDKSNPLKKLNNSLSHLKLNIRKYASKHDFFDSEETLVGLSEPPRQKSAQVKNAMKKMVRMSHSQHGGKGDRISHTLV